MAGARVGISVDSREVRWAFEQLVMRSMDLRDPLDEIGASLLTSTQQRFEDEEDPEGKPWLELSEERQQQIVKGKPRGPDHILRVTTNAGLYGSLTYLASNTDLQLGSNKVYAAIHQFGGEPDMAPGPAGVPARAYLGVSKDDEIEIQAILYDHLGEGIGGVQ